MNPQQNLSIPAEETQETVGEHVPPPEKDHVNQLISEIRDSFFEEEPDCLEPDQSDIRHIDQSATYEKQETVPRKQVLAIGDLDADFSSLVRILDKAGYIAFTQNKNRQKQNIHLRQKGLTGTVVQTGDFFDRGQKLLTTLDFINLLRENGVDFRMTAGNHDLMALYALSCSSVGNADRDFYRLIKDISRICRYQPSIAPNRVAHAVVNNDITNRLNNQSLPYHNDVLNFINWFYEGGGNLLKEMRDPEHQNYDNHAPSLKEQLEKARHLMFEDTDYARALSRLSVFEKIDDVLYLHAGVDDYWADIIEKKGFERINEDFRRDLKTKDLQDYVIGPKKNAFWMRGNALTPRSAQVLKKQGINAVVRGHDTMTSGQPESHHEYGIAVINIDIGIKAGRLGGALITPDNRIEGFTEKKRLMLANLPPLKRETPYNYEPKAKSA